MPAFNLDSSFVRPLGVGGNWEDPDAIRLKITASNDEEVVERILWRRVRRYGVPELGRKREAGKRSNKIERRRRTRQSTQDKMVALGVHAGCAPLPQAQRGPCKTWTRPVLELVGDCSIWLSTNNFLGEMRSSPIMRYTCRCPSRHNRVWSCLNQDGSTLHGRYPVSTTFQRRDCAVEILGKWLLLLWSIGVSVEICIKVHMSRRRGTDGETCFFWYVCETE